jgi:hypothetical protein
VKSHTLRRLVILTALAAACGPAVAGIALRVEAWPINKPLDAYVLVTDASGPVVGLTAEDFTVTLDGVELNEFGFKRPPSQDPTQHVSVVVVADGTYPPGERWESLIDELAIGDRVSVVKYWNDVERVRLGGLEVLPFTRLDGASGSDAVIDFLNAWSSNGFGGTATFQYDGIVQALQQFRSPPAPLPRGPKAILTLGGGGSRQISLSDVVALANEASIPIFNTRNSEWRPYWSVVARTRALAEKTGGIDFELQGNEPVRRAIARMARWLRHGYRVVLPRGIITDCTPRKLQISVQGKPVSTRVVRCDTTPEPFDLPDVDNVAVDTQVVSEAAVVNGTEAAASVRVFFGEYSVGCGSTFTDAPGWIQPGKRICVRHTTAPEQGVEAATILVVGGESSAFVSTTQ